MNASARGTAATGALTAIASAPPNAETLRRAYDALSVQLERVASDNDAHAFFTAWESERRSFASWKALVELRFHQNTGDGQARADVDALNELNVLTEHRDAEIKRILLTSAHRPALERTLGSYLFRRWENDVASFDDVLSDDLVAEAELVNEYTALLGRGRVGFRGESLPLAAMAGFAEDDDRAIRRAASEATWSFFRANATRLDEIFDQLVHLRAAMAGKLGLATYTGLAYRRMGRTDYDAVDVARFRAEIHAEIVPLAQEIAARQAHALGIPALMPWDEQVFDARGRLRAPASADAILSTLREAFAALHPALGAFVDLMADQGLTDLVARDGKSSGAFCTSFPTLGLPFVFANVNGASREVTSVVHEMGHAFQDYAARHKPALEYLIPTAEAGEIHSMSLEFLTDPQYERFFGDDASRFRAQHLATQLLMLPYIAAIDEFQERVYAEPDTSPAQRRALWKQLERRYLPWRNSGDIPHIVAGGLWQRQRHVYAFPFYYIDYGLAMCCALQLWSRSLRDHAGAVATYVALCERGGELPFLSLVESAGLRSPFEPGALAGVAALAREFFA
ncbi:MAG: M3 family oligoendopeptidase [Candidatus Eremiobacteraeota bacterium]|nr:M3 family oligoendopeptidase [Candidatus Eremiobacteraeota bacterium]